jgi:hypothetical protein
VPDVFTVSAAGARIGIDLSNLDPDRAAAVRAAWADAATEGEPDDVVVVHGTSTTIDLLAGLSQHVTLRAIEAGRGRGWMLHAAGVANDRGDVVVLVGPSGRGKTTASRELGRHFGYVSDETIAIEADGTVHAYRKPLSIIEDPAAPKTQVAPTQLGLRPLPDAELRVAAVALLDRRPDHEGEPVVEPLDLGDALAELVAQSSYLASHQAPLREIAGIVHATGGVRRVVYREAADLVAAIGTLADAGPSEGGASAEPLDLPAPAAHEPGDEPRYTRVAVTDAVALADPDRIAVMTLDDRGTGTVHVIAGIAPAVWLAASGATLTEMTDAALAAHGHPPEADAGAAVLAVVAELIDAGLLASDEPVFQRTAEVAWVDRADRVLAMPLGETLVQPTVLAGSAALVWEWLEQPSTLTQLVARAVEAGAPASAQTWAEIAAFLADLVAASLASPR